MPECHLYNLIPLSHSIDQGSARFSVNQLHPTPCNWYLLNRPIPALPYNCLTVIAGAVDMTKLRIPGVLQRLAISYGVVAIIHAAFASIEDPLRVVHMWFYFPLRMHKILQHVRRQGSLASPQTGWAYDNYIARPIPSLCLMYKFVYVCSLSYFQMLASIHIMEAPLRRTSPSYGL